LKKKRRSNLREKAICKTCGEDFKPTNNRSYECYTCVPQEHRNFNQQIKRKYGKEFGYVAYMIMLASQDNSCKICKIKVYPRTRALLSNSAVVDHCHETGRVRGILCRRCNLGLGYFDDRTELHYSAIEYLNDDSSPSGEEDDNQSI